MKQRSSSNDKVNDFPASGKMYKSEILCEVEEKVERRKCDRTGRMCSVCEGRLDAEKKGVEHRAGNTRQHRKTTTWMKFNA
jgi:hypothetical protein